MKKSLLTKALLAVREMPTQQTTNETTERAAPCPFCGEAELSEHENDCWFILRESSEDQRVLLAAWNRRAALPPTSGEAVKPTANIPQQAPCRNKLINEGAQMWPKSCQRCGIAKCPDGLVPNFPATKPAPAAPVADTGAVTEMEARKDAAYYERNQVVAALAKCFPSGKARTAIEGWSEDWHGCVYIDLPTGQVSWHYHDSQAHLFNSIPHYLSAWDGHDTDEKYRRLAALRATPASPAPTADSAADARDAVEIHDGYKVRKDGGIFDPDGKQLLPYIRNQGYLCVSMWEDGVRRDEYVHRLIAKAFCTKRSDLQTQVNHRDGDRTNNAASNLEWCTPQENSIHAARVLFSQDTRAVVGTRLADGEEVHFASLAEAAEHGFKRANIQKVINGERRSHGGYSWRDAAIASIQPTTGEKA